MQDLQTFLALAEPLPEEQVDYLDDEDINLFLQPFEVYGARLTPETQARSIFKSMSIILFASIFNTLTINQN